MERVIRLLFPCFSDLAVRADVIRVDEPLRGRYIVIVTRTCGISVYVILAVLNPRNEYVSTGQALGCYPLCEVISEKEPENTTVTLVKTVMTRSKVS